MLPTGELLVFGVTPADTHYGYRCRTVHHVTGETVESSNHARLIVTGISFSYFFFYHYYYSFKLILT